MLPWWLKRKETWEIVPKALADILVGDADPIFRSLTMLLYDAVNALGGVNPLGAGMSDGEINNSDSCCARQRDIRTMQSGSPIKEM